MNNDTTVEIEQMPDVLQDDDDFDDPDSTTERGIRYTEQAADRLRAAIGEDHQKEDMRGLDTDLEPTGLYRKPTLGIRRD